MTVVLVTPRLRLRELTAADAGYLYDLDNDPEVMRFINGGVATPLAAITEKILPGYMGIYGRHPGFGVWAAEDRHTGEFLGWFSLRPDDLKAGTATLGYRLRRRAWGRGLATEGALAVVRLGFLELGLKRIIATTYEDNAASRRVMEKIGMTLVRTFQLSPDALAAADSYHPAEAELWDGLDVEYAIERADFR